MKKRNINESGAFQPRIFFAFLLGSAAVFIAMLSFAATPPAGALTDTSGPLGYTAGPFFEPNAFGNTFAGECDPDPSDPLAPCDIYRLKVALPDDYAATHPNESVIVRVEWGTPAADFDLYLWDAKSWPKNSFPTGSPIAQSKQTATNFEQVEIPAVGGTRDLVVQVSTTLPAGQSIKGKIFLGPASPAKVPVVPPGNASGIAPRFQEYIPTDAKGAPSASLGLFAAEPTLFGNPKTGSVFSIAVYEVLRAKFDDRTSPAKALWEPKDRPTNISTKASVDPLLLGDFGTGRLFALQLSGGQSVTDYTDDDGETWTPTLSGGFASGVDHQGMGAGPYPKTAPGSLIPHPRYPNAIYYCSQDVGTAFCSRSDDGGQTYGASVPIYDSAISRCVGLHGHPKVAPDGTVYVPDKGCGLDTPVLGNGRPSVIVSEDAGITWKIRSVPDGTGSLLSKGDPTVSIDTNGKVYFAYQDLNNHMHVTTTTDRGLTWSRSVDVGALAGINYSVFPAATAGDAGRAAVAFFGSTYDGPVTNYQKMTFPGVWHLYVATTYDGGNTWFVANATPDQPVQGAFGGIGGGGDNRNHFDFIDSQTDRDGRVIVTTSVGCVASCSQNGGPNSFTSLAKIVRQSGGRRMLAKFDPQEPAVSAAPLINGYRTAKFISFSWPEPDASGGIITGYNVYRSVNGGAETMIRSAIMERRVVELAAPADTSSYRVTALSAQGESVSSNTFAPALGQNAPQPELSCKVPGQLYFDRTGEGGTFPNNDIASFGIAEPENMPGKLVFTVNNANPAATAEANSEYYVFFDPPRGGLSYRLNLQNRQVEFYKNGQIVACGTAGISDCRDWKSAGALDPASGIKPDGSVWLVIDKAKYDIRNGDVLLGISIREDSAGNPSRIITTDFAGGRQDYLVVGNDFCTPARLANISTRVPVRRGDGAGIAGFIVGGTGPRNVIIRGIGPSLQVGGNPVPGRLENPTLSLHDGQGALIAQNDNWRESDQAAAIQATGIPPSDDRESAIVRQLDPGNYTAVLRGANETEGIAIAEVYDLDAGGTSELANISTRGSVETSDNILIGGFILRGNSAPVLLRAIGPSLSGSRVPNALQDPTMELRDVNGTLLAANDNWKDSQQAEISATSIAPADDRESAILRSLPGGSYTAIVRGKGDTSGVGLIEAYKLRVP